MASCISEGSTFRKGMQVYDCRSVTDEALELMAARGLCLFCNAPVPIAVAAAAAGFGTPPPAATPEDGSTSAETAGTETAQAFKDRMVEYDRTATQRTAVIDDQGDFYEIEGNAWLSPEERDEMKQRQLLEDQVREERRNRMVVSVDLIGRTVCSR